MYSVHSTPAKLPPQTRHFFYVQRDGVGLHLTSYRTTQSVQVFTQVGPISNWVLRVDGDIEFSRVYALLYFFSFQTNPLILCFSKLI